MTVDGHYHLNVHAISRRKGRSIHAAVAYRHGTRELTASAAAAYRHAQEHGEALDAYDYRHKIGVQWFGIVAPDDAPAWARDPKILWREVDKTERRINARLAQEVIVALPHQLTLEQHIVLMREFATTYCVEKYRMVADIALHEPPTHTGGDARNFHAHILLTDRPIGPDGFAAAKDRRYSDKGLVDEFREGWTLVHNRTMERLGLPHRIDHRSLKAQRDETLERGDEANAILLDRIPQIHVGKAAHATHPRFPIYQDRLKRHREILAANTATTEAREIATQKQHHHAALAALEEKARIEYQRATWKPEPPSLPELHATYGRLGASAELLRQNIRRQAEHAAAENTWLPKYAEKNEPSILAYLMGRTAIRKPSRFVFTVTARDLAFAFYDLGLSSLDGLHRSLENIAADETQRHPKAVKKQKPRPPLPKRTPPTYPRPQQEIARKLEARMGHIQVAMALHMSRQAAYERRYVERTWAKEARQRAKETRSHELATGRSRGRLRQSPPADSFSS